MSHFISIVGDTIKVDIQRRFNEFDMGNHLNNVAYFNYIEIAKAETFATALSIDLTKVLAAVASFQIDFLKPIIFGTPVSVLVNIKNIKDKSKEVYFKIVNANDTSEVFAKASLVQVCFDTKTGKPVRVPDEIREQVAFLETNEEVYSLKKYREMVEDLKSS